MKELKCKIKQIKFHKKESSWFALKTDQGDVTGVIKYPINEGDTIILKNPKQTTWKTFTSWTFFNSQLEIPQDKIAQFRWIARNTKGMGKKMEDDIVGRFGENWGDLQARDVMGLTETVYKRFLEAKENFNENYSRNDAISFLLNKKCSERMAELAFEQWKEKTQTVVMENCYHLAELPNFGFANVDKEIRAEFGIGDKDNRRLIACLSYVMKQEGLNGDTVLERTKIENLIIDKLGGIEKNLILNVIKDELSRRNIVNIGNGIASSVKFNQEYEIYNFIRNKERIKNE